MYGMTYSPAHHPGQLIQHFHPLHANIENQTHRMGFQRHYPAFFALPENAKKANNGCALALEWEATSKQLSHTSLTGSRHPQRSYPSLAHVRYILKQITSQRRKWDFCAFLKKCNTHGFFLLSCRCAGEAGKKNGSN